MEFKTREHKNNYYILKELQDFPVFKKGKVEVIRGDIVTFKFYDIYLLKLNMLNGSIYFDQDKYLNPNGRVSRTTSEIQNIITKWLEDNSLTITNIKNTQTPYMTREELNKVRMN